MVMTRKPLFLQGTQAAPVLHPAEDTRLNMAAFWNPDATDPLKVRSGIVWGVGETAAAQPLAVTSSGASQVQVTRGRAVIQGTTANSGAYVVTVDSVQTRTIPGASLPGAGQFKAGYVIVHVYDTVYGDAQDAWDVEVILGAAASTQAGAAYPTVPNNSLVLRSFTTDSSGNLTLGGTPLFTAPAGRPVPCLSTARPTGWYGGKIWESDTGYLRVWDGYAWVYAGVLGISALGNQNGAIHHPVAQWVTTGQTYTVTTAAILGWTAVANENDGKVATQSGATFTITERGLYNIVGYCNSDNGNGGNSFLSLQLPGGPFTGQGGAWTTRQHRATGYSGCGQVSNVVTSGPVYLEAGWTFNLTITEGSANGSSTVYDASMTITRLPWAAA